MKKVIEEYSSRPFRYGDADCCQFVGACVEAMRGYNPVASFDYSGEDGATKLIASWGDLYSLVRANLGDPCTEYRDGDIALFNQIDGTQILGVVEGDEVILKSFDGLVRWPIEYAYAVWST